MLIECPSGLSFHARKWCTGDQKLLLDKAIVRSGFLLQKMLEAAMYEFGTRTLLGGVQSPGPYPFDAEGPIDWKLVSIPDMLGALYTIRKITDPELELDPKCKYCDRITQIVVDMNNEEKVQSQPMHPLAIEAIHGNGDIPLAYVEDTKEFYTSKELSELGSGIKSVAVFYIRMLIGKDQPLLLKMQAKEPEAIEEIAICHRVTKIAANGKGEISTSHGIRRFYQMTDWPLRKALRAKIEQLEGGVDSEISVYCKHCDGEQTFIVPLGPGFFGLT